MPTAEEIRAEIDEVLNILFDAIEKGKAGFDLTFAFWLIPQVMTLLTVGQNFMAATALEKATYGGEAFDAMVGTDATAKVKVNFEGFSNEDFEEVTDMLKTKMIKILAARLAADQPPLPA